MNKYYFKICKLFSTFRVRLCFTILIIFTLWKICSTLNGYYNQQIIDSIIQKQEKALMMAGGVQDITSLPVGVYYEALCPDSRNFILQHLVPSFNKAPNSFDIEFVPYGKATTYENSDGSFSFKCQHGPNECKANKIHSCAIQYVKDKIILVKYVSCMIDNNYEPVKIGNECAKKFNINWNEIYDCSEGKEGEQLLKLNGEATALLRPSVSFIPTITISHEQPRQASVLKNFWAVACTYFPSESKPAGC